MSTTATSISDQEDEIEIINGSEIDEIPIALNETFYDYADPRLVYSNSNLGRISEGLSFMIKGSILINCERFSINFIVNTPTRDIALHLNPRLPQNYIVRNSKTKGKWGKEEIPSPFPFCLERGKKFSIQILITKPEFLISINGKHFAKFAHRLPFEKIMCLEIKGDIENVSVDSTKITQYPTFTEYTEPQNIEVHKDKEESLNPSKLLTSNILQTNLKSYEEIKLEMPFCGKIVNDLIGKCLRIEGRVKLLPHSFHINLQDSYFIWPHPSIAFHLNPRFANIGGKLVVCHNSWQKGQWDQEERTEMKVDFMPGSTFSLLIFCSELSFDVYLNKKFLTEFKHRLRPEIVNTIFIQGDIILYNVILENKNKPDFSLYDYYENYEEAAENLTMDNINYN